MKVFLSVAGPDRPKVEEVAYELRGEGHQVFLDEHSLPPGASHHRQIREAILQADIVVCFVSPLWLQSERYTLTELKIIQDKWDHPRGHVLPVVLSNIDLNTLPAYLKVAKAYKPKGHMPAEIAYVVSRMVEDLERRRAGAKAERAALLESGQSSFSTFTRGALSALLLGALTIIIGILTNQLAPILRTLSIPPLGYAVFHGIALSLIVWLAAVLYGLRSPLVFVTLAVGCIAAYTFEALAYPTMKGQLQMLAAGKSIVFALCAAMVLPGFRNPTRWGCLAAAGFMAGQLEIMFGWPLRIFVWEMLLVATVAFFLALNESDSASASQR